MGKGWSPTTLVEAEPQLGGVEVSPGEQETLRRAGPELPATGGLLGAFAASVGRADGVGGLCAGPGGRAHLATSGEGGAASSSGCGPGPRGLVGGDRKSVV